MNLKSITAISINLFFISISFGRTYEDVFPKYFEYCTATQVKYTKNYFDGAKGGPGGHGFIYVHGLCKDMDSAYPRVLPCDQLRQGVGISLDSDYANVMWIAVPGRELFFNGNHDENDELPVDKAELENLIANASSHKVFQGVKLKAKEVNQFTFGTKEYEDAAANWSIGTDIGIRIGRELRCVRTPINDLQVNDLANYLNLENEKYILNDKIYDWSFLSNNCTHLTLNAGNVIGLNKRIKTDKNLLSQIGNIAIPANAFMNLADEWVLKTPKLSKILKSSSVKKYGVHPNQAGAIMYKLDVFQSNHMFLTDSIKGISLPRLKFKRPFKTAKSYDNLMTPENVSLEENITKWKEIYQNLFNELQQKSDSKTIEDNYVLDQFNFINSL